MLLGVLLTDCLINRDTGVTGVTGVRLAGLPGLCHLPGLTVLPGCGGAIVSWNSFTDIQSPAVLTDLSGNLTTVKTRSSVLFTGREGTQFAPCPLPPGRYLLWVINALLSGLVGALLFGDISTVNSGDLLTFPHFSQGIILQSNIVVGNSRDVGIFFTNFIWNNVLKRGPRDRGETQTLDSLTLGDVESPALFLLYLSALDVAHNIIHSGADRPSLLPTILCRLGPALLLVAGGADLVRHGGADRLLDRLVLRLTVRRGGALSLLQRPADLWPGNTVTLVPEQVLSLTLPVLHHPALPGLSQRVADLLQACRDQEIFVLRRH